MISPRATLILAGILTAVSALPVVTSPLAAQDGDRDSGQEWLDHCRRQRNNRDRERVCELRTESFRPGAGALRVNTSPNGGVIVESWPGSEIEVEARIQAEGESAGRASEIARSIDVRHNGNSLVPTGPEMDRQESWSVVYYVKVPRTMDLDLKTINGPIGVRNMRSHIIARTTNGPVSLTDVGGDVKANSGNGPISVRLSGTRWEGAGLDAETGNGPVTLSIPDDYNADLEAGTTNGPFNTDIALNVRVIGRRTTHINTKLGDGGAPVRVVTTNGPISIHRR
jgi:hypothetical protein